MEKTLSNAAQNALCVGRQYGAFGSAFDWWSSETSAKFDERAQCFVEQYSSYRVSEINKTVSTLYVRTLLCSEAR
jgi:predicted metalloendopeptidase